MEISIKNFNSLSTNELYEILQLRSEVFVMEQECLYQDIDGKDLNALHVLGIKNKRIIAYARCFDAGIYAEDATIGRVVVDKLKRGKNYGHILLKAAVAAIYTQYGTKTIQLSAQEYLIKFYESHGFETRGTGYLEDGIPHILMIKNFP